MAGERKAALAAAVAMLALAPAGAQASSFAMAEDCAEHESFVHGDEAAVAARLPARYTVVRESGKPLVYARAVRCARFTIGDRTAPATIATYGIVVESQDGRGCASGSPAGAVKGDFPPACNLYALAWLSDDAHVARWLPFRAVHAPGLKFGLDGGTFAFRAQDWSIDATGSERPGEIAIRRAYRAATPRGTATLHFTSETLVAGEAKGTVSAAPGSELARLMGADERSYAGAYGSFAMERFASGVFRRQLADTDGLSGSCSFQGNLTFTPPVSGTDQPFAYAYHATGRCGGTPAGLRHAGRAFGGCSHGYTTTPGEGTLELATGRRIDYTLDFTTEQTELTGTIYGERTGLATATGSFLTDRTPPDAAARCGSEGVSTLPMDFTLETVSPLAGDRRRPAAAPPAAEQP
ncbi:MAG TPA: hypothetical protein VGW10_04050, partial [Solirubrobacteraceae bacterium]|nr:hypothetical protein [Solirubrobacteraceae bacterium]